MFDNKLIAKSFMWMFIGLLVTFLTGFVICLNKETLLADLKKSREQLNGSTVFCYPFFEYNDYAISVLKEAGFEMAFIGGRYKIKVGSNKYKLPRYGIINTTYVEDIKKIIN